MTGDEQLAAQIKQDYRQAPVDLKTRAILDFAVDVTRYPETLSARNVDALREVGWTDAEILTATQVIGFFNFYARMADALGVEPEDFMRPANEAL